MKKILVLLIIILQTSTTHKLIAQYFEGDIQYELYRINEPFNTADYNIKLNEQLSSKQYKINIQDSTYFVEQILFGKLGKEIYLGNDSLVEMIQLDTNNEYIKGRKVTYNPLQVDSTKISQTDTLILGIKCQLLEVWTPKSYTKFYYSDQYKTKYAHFKHHEISTLFECSKLTNSIPIHCQQDKLLMKNDGKYMLMKDGRKFITEQLILSCLKLPE